MTKACKFHPHPARSFLLPLSLWLPNQPHGDPPGGGNADSQAPRVGGTRICISTRSAGIWQAHQRLRAFPGQTVKSWSAVQETRVQSLGQGDPLEEGMGTTPVFLPGVFHGQRSLVDYRPWGCKKSDMTEQPTLHLELKKHCFCTHYIKPDLATEQQQICKTENQQGSLV